MVQDRQNAPGSSGFFTINLLSPTLCRGFTQRDSLNIRNLQVSDEYGSTVYILRLRGLHSKHKHPRNVALFTKVKTQGICPLQMKKQTAIPAGLLTVFPSGAKDYIKI